MLTIARGERLDDVRGVEAAAEAHLEDGHVHALPAEVGEGGGGEHLEERGVRLQDAPADEALGRVAHVPHGAREVAVADLAAVHGDPLVDPHEVGRRVAAGAQARGAQHGVAVGGHRALAVGAGDEERRVGALGVAHLGDEGAHRLEAELDAEADAAGEVEAGDAVGGEGGIQGRGCGRGARNEPQEGLVASQGREAPGAPTGDEGFETRVDDGRRRPKAAQAASAVQELVVDVESGPHCAEAWRLDGSRSRGGPRKQRGAGFIGALRRTDRTGFPRGFAGRKRTTDRLSRGLCGTEAVADGSAVTFLGDPCGDPRGEGVEKWKKVWNTPRLAVFKGTYHHRIDAKGRLPVPAAFRRSLGDQGHVVVTLLDQCLAAYSPSEWAKLEGQLAALPAFSKPVKALTRLLASRAADCEIDVQGRILLPPGLR